MEKLEKKKKHFFYHIKNSLFYVFWLAESKFVMEKEVWQPGFGDNLKKLSKRRVSVKKLKRKNNIVSITLNTLYFMYFGLPNPNLLWKKRFGSRVSEIISKNCLKAVFVWKNLRRIKKHCFHHIKNTLFLCIWAC